MATAPTAEECNHMVGHLLDLVIAEHPDFKLSDAERASMRRDLETAHAADCRAMARKSYDCAISAPTTAAMTACD